MRDVDAIFPASRNVWQPLAAPEWSRVVSLRLPAAVAATLAFLALAASANASVSFIPYGTALPTGEHTITDFATLAGVTGSAGLFTGSEGGVSAAPAFSATAADTAPYLSVQGAKTATLSLGGAYTVVSVYVGSLDNYNMIAFGGPGATSYTGGQLAALTGAVDGGGQVARKSNGRFIFDFAAPVTSITFSSGSNALEVASVAGGVADEPEPAAWALMLIGVGGLGAILRSRRRPSAIA
jgi:hypothetical protein